MEQPNSAEEVIPEVDLTLEPNLAAEQLVNALTTIGFCYVVGHGVPSKTIAAAFSEATAYFAQPMAEKLRHRRDWRVQTCGYIPPHWAVTGAEDEPPVERFSLDAPPDEKEALNVCHSCTTWPSDTVRRVSIELINSAQELVLRLLRLLEIGLELSPAGKLTAGFGKFAAKGNGSQLRLLHYPPLLGPAESLGQRCGEHTDYGCITLVFCDSQPGLQVLSRSGNYLDASPRAERVLVNIGDLMQRWTGGRLRSARHRVIVPADPEKRALPRYSLVYFSICDDEFTVRPLLGDADSFLPVKTGDHLNRRFQQTFTMGQGIDPELPMM